MFAVKILIIMLALTGFQTRQGLGQIDCRSIPEAEPTPRPQCTSRGLARQIRSIKKLMEERLDRENGPAGIFLLLVTHAMTPALCLINLAILICVLHEGAPRGEAMEVRGHVDSEENLSGYPDFGMLQRIRSYEDLTMATMDPAPPSYEEATSQDDEANGGRELDSTSQEDEADDGLEF